MQKQIFKPKVYTVKSEKDGRKSYLVTNYRPNLWQCTCKDYIYRSHDEEGYSTNHKCKHILEVIEDLKEGRR